MWDPVYDVALEDVEESMTHMPEKFSNNNIAKDVRNHNGEDDEEEFELE